MTNPAGGNWSAPSMPTGITLPSTPVNTTAPVTPTTQWTAPTMPSGVTGQTTIAGTVQTPTAPGAQGPELTDLPGGWQVSPDEVKKFASAVQQVRNDLTAVLHQVDQLTSPSYQPQLGTSPVGQALTAKFLDRLAGGQGLLPNLQAVLQHLDAFVANAEQVASNYVSTESTMTDTLKSL